MSHKSPALCPLDCLMPITIQNLTRQTLLASNARVADSFLSRMVGLLKTSSLKQGEALVITRCNSIHMFGMRYPIDVVFIDGKQTVVGCVESIQPNRLSPIFWQASQAIELPSGSIKTSQTQVNDQLKIGGQTP